MPKTILEVKNLTKKFKDFTAVDNISFNVKEGEIVGLLGPNGAGKTTTIQMTLGLITPSEGKIEIFEEDLFTHKEEILSRVNFSSTYTHLPYRLSVWENLYVVALLYSVVNAKEKVEEVIKIMKLGEYRNQTIRDLSSGWVTRVNLARTLLNTPKLILLDEPTASLDPEGAIEIRRVITDYRKKNNSTILWTSHNMAEVEEVCDRVIFLKEGRIIAVDTPEGLAKSIPFCRISLLVYTRKEELLEIVKLNNWKVVGLERFITIELAEKAIPILLGIINKEGIEYSEISIEKPSLEDFFISHVR